VSDFSLEIANEADGATIRMAGAIDEMVDLTLPTSLPPGVVRLELGGVDSINSLGVGKWLRFIDELRSRTSQIVVRNLSTVLVFQASMISSFLEGAEVESFVVPYECDSCSNAEDRLFQSKAEVPGTMTCPKCQSQMDLDSEPEFYLAFQ